MVKRPKRKSPNDLEIFFRTVYQSLSRKVLEASAAGTPPQEKKAASSAHAAALPELAEAVHRGR